MGAACTKFLIYEVVAVAAEFEAAHLQQQPEIRTYPYDERVHGTSKKSSSSSSSSSSSKYRKEDDVHVTEIILPPPPSQSPVGAKSGGAPSTSSSSSSSSSSTAGRTKNTRNLIETNKSPSSSSASGTGTIHTYEDSATAAGAEMVLEKSAEEYIRNLENPFKAGSNKNKRKMQTDADEQALLDLTTCRAPESWRGCQPMSQWLVHNSDPLINGWRVLEVQFFSDRKCENKLKWNTPLSARFLSCGQQGQGFAPVNGMDNKPQTQWISECGTESLDCDGIPNAPSDPNRDMCRSFDDRYNGQTPSEANYKGTYIGATFASPQAVQCVRLLQAGAPYRSDRLTVTSHNQNDCYICAHGAMPLADTFQDGFDTYIGTPGLKLELYTNLRTWDNTHMPQNWPTTWEGVVRTDNLNVTTNSSDINYPRSPDPWRPGWPHPKQEYIARWQGLLRIMTTGPYQFLLQCDTEARMYFGSGEDRQLVLQNNGSASQLVGLYYEAELSMPVLEAGVRYFEVQYKHLTTSPGGMVNDQNGIIISYKGPDTIPTETTTTTMGMPVKTKNDGRPPTTLPPPSVMDIALWKVLPPESMMRGITDDDAVSNSVYILEPKKHCHSIRYRIFGDRPAAQAACDADPTCGGIYGRDCNIAEDTYQGLYLCKLPVGQSRLVLGNRTEFISTENSCVYVKYDASETTTFPPITAGPLGSANRKTDTAFAAMLLTAAGTVAGYLL
ncbi:unnamed protein product [Amoebophrya sp. A120]|nr:unnamed protein product [Amoebophrya sp. A120]|eukprot:GSA120T00006403001.1